MSLVSPTLPSPGDAANASDISTPISQLATVINGGIDDTNISAVSGSKIAAATVTNDKLSTTAGQIGGAWIAYTPTLTASTTNPNVGASGTVEGYYQQVGKTVNFRGNIVFSGAGLTAGSGTYTVALPVTPKDASATMPVGHLFLRDASTAMKLGGIITATGLLQIYNSTTNHGGVTNSAPWAWTTDDSLSFSGTYEAA